MGNKLPNSLIKRLNDDSFFDVENFKFLQKKRLDTIRFNNAKKIKPEEFPIGDPVPWCDNAYYLRKELIFEDDPLFFAGAYSIQNSRALILDFVMRKLELHNREIKVLDLVASDGALSSLISAVIQEDSLLIVNESNPSYISSLREKLSRWGNSNFVISQNDSSAFSNLPGYFDFLLVQAPSSQTSDNKTALFQEDDTFAEQVQLHRERQKRLLRNSIPALKTDGYLFYGVESNTKEECADIIEWLIHEFSLETVDIAAEGFKDIIAVNTKNDANFSYRFLADNNYNSFFFVVLRRRSSQAAFSYDNIDNVLTRMDRTLTKDWIYRDDMCTIQFKDAIYTFPKGYEHAINALLHVLSIDYIGLCMGQLEEPNFLIPSVELALNNLLRKDLPFHNLKRNEALSLLKGKDICLSTKHNAQSYDWIILRYKGVNIGWKRISCQII